MTRVMFYCQHVLGMGHLVRSMELVRGLKDFQVSFFNGGEVVPGFPLPPSVEIVQLPALKADENFTEISSADGSQNVAGIKDARVRCLLDGYERLDPDVLIIELFPFGRKQFAFELVPLLSRIRLAGGKTKVVCSLRDILVSRKDQVRHEARVCTLLNRYFDAVLIHADPKMQRLEETFSSVGELKAEIKYTGYVAQTSDDNPADSNGDDISLETSGDPLILVSIGGGRVGYELLACAIEASAIVAQTRPHRMLVFTGPYLPEAQYDQLERRAEFNPNVTLRRYTSRFMSYMEKADLSVSMAGYNTCMNLLTARISALVLPFTGGDNNEQSIRARKLEELGVVTVIHPQELQPARLAENIIRRLQSKPPQSVLDLRGVENTAAYLRELVERRDALPKAEDVSPAGRSGFSASRRPVETALKFTLGRIRDQGKEVRVFLRDDDIDEDEETLRQLLDIAFARQVPVNLEIIPAKLTDTAVGVLREYKGFQPTLIELHQHGWQHVNHENVGKKCEFGAGRCFDDQFADIARGKTRLEEAFGDKFFPAFTPPWNRCTEDTLKVLDRLGFAVLSRDRNGHAARGYGFQEISVTLDLFRWKGGVTLKNPEEILTQLISQIETCDTVGILLHHKVMDVTAFSFLDFLLTQLRHYPNVKFHTFQSLLHKVN